MRTTWMMTLALAGVLTLAGTAHAGPVGAAKDAVDPDCTAGKAVKGAAERAAVGVGNRCKPAETARDMVGVDKKHSKGSGPVKKHKND